MTSLDGSFDTATVIGLMWFQHDAGLPVDGHVTAETRQLLEAGFSDMHDGLLGDHLAPRVLVDPTATDAVRYQAYRSIVLAAGGVFLDGPREITMLGIRGVIVTQTAAGLAAPGTTPTGSMTSSSRCGTSSTRPARASTTSASTAAASIPSRTGATPGTARAPRTCATARIATGSPPIAPTTTRTAPRWPGSPATT